MIIIPISVICIYEKLTLSFLHSNKNLSKINHTLREIPHICERKIRQGRDKLKSFSKI